VNILEKLLIFDIKIFRTWDLSKILMIVGVCAALLWSVYFAFVVIFTPHQISYHEGTALVQTWLFLNKQNPFTLENHPLGMNNYGIGYSLAVLPFAAVFGNTLLVHRSVTFGFVILSALIIFFVVYRAKRDVSLGLVCATFVLIGLMTGEGIGAFPSAMGACLFLVAVLFPFTRSFSWSSLIASALASFIAFYTKPYFVLSFGVVVSYLFLFVSKRKGLVYAFWFITSFFLLFLAIKYIFPTYFIDVIWGNVFNTDARLGHMLMQLGELFFSFLFIFIVLFLIGITRHSTEKNGDAEYLRSSLVANVVAWDAPLMGPPLSYLFFSLLFVLLAFMLILGWHVANHLGYAYQLVVPVFLCWFFVNIAPANKTKLFLVVMVLINLFVWQAELLDPSRLRRNNLDQWDQLMGYMKPSKSILNAPPVTAEVINLGLSPVDSGQTILFYNVRYYPETILANIPYKEFRLDGLRFGNTINHQIEKQKFDLIITVNDKATFFDTELMEDYYFLAAEINLEMNVGQYWPLSVWKPKLQ
jgi:hypothetical protein